MAPLDALLDLLEAAAGPAEPLPSTDGWELVLAENVAYLVDDDRRREAMRRLRQLVGIEPEQILAAPDDVLLQVVTGMQPTVRATRLRRCAELAIAEASWSRFPGIGKPGAERIELFSGTRAVLALDSNALRVLVRLGYGGPDAAYATTYRQAQAQASAELAETVPARQRAHQMLRRHGQTICRRSAPTCPRCPAGRAMPQRDTLIVERASENRWPGEISAPRYATHDPKPPPHFAASKHCRSARRSTTLPLASSAQPA